MMLQCKTMFGTNKSRLTINVEVCSKSAAIRTKYRNNRSRRFSVFSDDSSVQKPDSSDSDEWFDGESDLDSGDIIYGARVLHPDKNGKMFKIIFMFKIFLCV